MQKKGKKTTKKRKVRKLLHYQLLFCKRIALERDTKNLEDIKLVDEH
jgi:hypothetical protein